MTDPDLDPELARLEARVDPDLARLLKQQPAPPTKEVPLCGLSRDGKPVPPPIDEPGTGNGPEGAD